MLLTKEMEGQYGRHHPQAEGIDRQQRQHRVFRRRRRVHRVRDTGLPQRGRPVPPEVQIPAGDHAQPHILRDAHRGILRLLPGQNAGPGRPAQRRPPQAGGMGAAGEAEGRHHPEHRRPAPEGRQPGGP